MNKLITLKESGKIMHSERDSGPTERTHWKKRWILVSFWFGSGYNSGYEGGYSLFLRYTVYTVYGKYNKTSSVRYLTPLERSKQPRRLQLAARVHLAPN